jgi:hypothetical protein
MGAPDWAALREDELLELRISRLASIAGTPFGAIAQFTREFLRRAFPSTRPAS